MKLLKIFLISFMIFLSSCGQQEKLNTENQEKLDTEKDLVVKKDYNIEDIFIWNNSAYLGDTVEIEMKEIEEFSTFPEKFFWEFTYLPEKAKKPKLLISNNWYKVTFLPDKEGQYEFVISDWKNIRNKKISVFYKVPYDENKIEKFSEKSFYVTNQFLFYVNFSEEELEKLLEKYSNLALKYYEYPYKNPHKEQNTKLTLVYLEVIDEDSEETKKQLSEFEKESWVEFIWKRFENWGDLSTTNF